MEKFIYHRYYTVFGEKGYIVRDSEDDYKIVFKYKTEIDNLIKHL